MSNEYSAFLGLLPSESKNVGKVLSVSGENHTVQLIGGGTLIATSQKAYEVGNFVFLQGKVIISQAPDNPTETLYV